MFRVGTYFCPGDNPSVRSKKLRYSDIRCGSLKQKGKPERTTSKLSDIGGRIPCKVSVTGISAFIPFLFRFSSTFDKC
jgi:hypothetical protein